MHQNVILVSDDTDESLRSHPGLTHVIRVAPASQQCSGNGELLEARVAPGPLREVVDAIFGPRAFPFIIADATAAAVAASSSIAEVAEAALRIRRAAGRRPECAAGGDVVLLMLNGDGDTAAEVMRAVAAEDAAATAPLGLPTLVPVCLPPGVAGSRVVLGLARALLLHTRRMRGEGSVLNRTFGTVAYMDALRCVGLWCSGALPATPMSSVSISQGAAVLHEFLVASRSMAVSAYSSSHFRGERPPRSATRGGETVLVADSTPLEMLLVIDVDSLAAALAEHEEKMKGDDVGASTTSLAPRTIFEALSGAAPQRKLCGLVAADAESCDAVGCWAFECAFANTTLWNAAALGEPLSLAELRETLLPPALAAARFDTSHFPAGPNRPFLSLNSTELDEKFGGLTGLLHNVEQREVLAQLPQLANAIGELMPGAGLEGGLEGRCVVDVGCGTGNITEEFVSAVGSKGRIIGQEVSRGFIDLCRRRFAKCGSVVSLALTPEDSLVGIPSGVADVALICDVYHHFAFPLASMREVRRVLKPVSGLLVLIEFKRDPAQHISHPGNSEWVLGHVRGDERAIVQEISHCGFRLHTQQLQGMRDGENFYKVFTVDV